jgi:hypothetical protein
MEGDHDQGFAITHCIGRRRRRADIDYTGRWHGRYTTFLGWYGNLGAGQPTVGLLKDSTIDAEIFTPQGMRKFGTR